MSETDNTAKLLDNLKKKLDNIDKKQDTFAAECKDIFAKLEAKISLILSIIEDFEILIDSSVSDEDEDMDDKDNLYKEWTPYDEAYEAEDYDSYDDEENDF